MRFDKVSGPPMASYDVSHDGQNIGNVRYWERRYNLRRLYVSRGWRAYAPDGTPVGFHPDNYTGATRAEAAEVLLAAHLNQPRRTT